MKERNCKHESHQRGNAAASLPPRSDLPCITHRADTIPLRFVPFSIFALPLAFTHWPRCALLVHQSRQNLRCLLHRYLEE